MYGHFPLKDIRYVTAKEWHMDWLGPENKVAIAHALISTLRTLVGFGLTLLEDVEEVEVFGVARAIGTRLFPAARLPESETEPRITPERMFFGLLVIDDAGRAGRRGADESILASLRSRERGRKLWFGNPSERL